MLRRIPNSNIIFKRTLSTSVAFNQSVSDSQRYIAATLHTCAPHHRVALPVESQSTVLRSYQKYAYNNKWFSSSSRRLNNADQGGKCRLIIHIIYTYQRVTMCVAADCPLVCGQTVSEHRVMGCHTLKA